MLCKTVHPQVPLIRMTALFLATVLILGNGVIAEGATKPPTIGFASANNATFVLGVPGSFAIEAVATPTPSLSLSGTLPTGVSFVAGSNGTATISGTPSQSGTFSVTITATNSSASVSQSFSLTVDGLGITSADNLTSANGSVSFTVTTSGSPTPNLSETGSLPAGITFRDNGNGTATISGSTTATGAFSITITAANTVAPNATQDFTLVVNPISASVAARFLEQSSWGPTAATIAQVQSQGIEGFLQSQFAAPASTYTSTVSNLGQVQNQFFVNAVNGQDQLRQRVSFALAEIMVISGVGPNIKSPTAFPLYMNMLQNDAFGNFFNLINDVTLSPAMGSYLNMAENNGCATRCRPNENYAREILQLFTIGLYELNPDGTPVLQNGAYVPTYAQSTIEGFGALFTGWGYPGRSAFFGGPNYTGPMIPYQVQYSTASKSLLNGYTIGPYGNIETDLTSGLQNIFTHPNVAPFICQQLIQKLVTGDPLPAYVSRCSQVFNDDGTGVRGNLQAVVSEILLDPEARRGDNAAQVDANDGHLREPLLHILASLRAVNATTDGVNLSTYGSNMSQAPFLAPSVFNFYPPTFPLVVGGTQLIAPEFSILNANTAMFRANFINDLIYGTVGPNTKINITPYVNAADPTQGGSVGALLGLINTNIMHGQMPTDMQSAINTALTSGAFTTPTSEAQAALYLTLASNQFQIEH
jgi:uncharacterized protein (DUF1800 family)